MVLKSDSSLLNNKKPFFIPNWSNDICVTPCVVLRVSRLGKNIQAKFASRYYDAVALGLNIVAADYLVKGDWTRGYAFDFSLPIGSWMALADNPWHDLVVAMEDAVSMASQVMTIRQGDMIVIDTTIPRRRLEREEIIQIENNQQELLYCKIK